MYSSIFLSIPMCVSVFFIVTVAMNVKRENAAQRSIIWAFIASFLIFLGKTSISGLFFSPAIDTLYMVGLLAVYPACYRTIVMLCKMKAQPWQNIVLLAPSLICGAALAVSYIHMDSADIAIVMDKYRSGILPAVESAALRQIDLIHNAALVVYVLEVGYVLIMGLHDIKKFDNSLYRLFSNLRGHSLKSVGRWLVIAIVTSIATTLFDSLYFGSRIESSWSVAMPAIIIAIALALFGVTVIRQKYSAAEQRQMLNRCQFNADDKAAEQQRGQIAERVNDMMEKEQLYLNPDLELADIAWRLRVSCQWLSESIERRTGMTFYDYVNRYRILRATMLLAAPSDRKRREVLNEAWRNSGFSSRRQMQSVIKEFRLATPE